MRYAVITEHSDALKANALLAGTDYYKPNLDMRLEGGVWIGAFDEDELAACVQLKPHGVGCDLDYLAANPKCPGAGIRLLRHVKEFLTDGGYHRVTFAVHESNMTANTIGNMFGATFSGPYWMGTATLGDPDGREEAGNHQHSDDRCTDS